MKAIEEIYAIADAAMETGLSLVKEHQPVQMMIHLLAREGPDELILPKAVGDGDGQYMGIYKDAIDGVIREKLKTGRFEGVVMMALANFSHVSPAQEAVVDKIGIEAAAKRGLCCLHEAIVVFLETPMVAEEWQQEYATGPDGNVVTRGEMEKRRQAEMDISRFGGLFTAKNTRVQ